MQQCTIYLILCFQNCVNAVNVAMVLHCSAPLSSMRRSSHSVPPVVLRSGKCKVEDTPKGWYITLIQRDPNEELTEEKRNKRMAAEKAEEERHLAALADQVGLAPVYGFRSHMGGNLSRALGSILGLNVLKVHIQDTGFGSTYLPSMGMLHSLCCRL